jgi:AraC-like DNA-binding protein
MNQVALVPDFYDHRAGCWVESHVHDQGQVLIATEGRMEVQVGARRMAVDPGTALWVPAGVPHAARSVEPTAFRGIMIDRPHASLLPGTWSAFPATLILLAAAPELSAPRAQRRMLASSLLLDELFARLLAPQTAPAPRSERLAALCARVCEDPAAAPNLDQAARQAGASRRTFSRAFRKETGKSWAAWVRDLRISRAAALLAEGARVTDVALAVGYSTPSAFSVAFRRRAGQRPKDARPGS